MGSRVRSRKTGDGGREEEERNPRDTKSWKRWNSASEMLRRAGEHVKGRSVASPHQAQDTGNCCEPRENSGRQWRVLTQDMKRTSEQR